MVKVEERMLAWGSLVVAAVLLYLAHGSAFGYVDSLGFFEGIWYVAWIAVAFLLTVFIVGVWPGMFSDGTLMFPFDEGRNSWILFVALVAIFWLYHGLLLGVYA
jgi:hypothetical protein